MANRNKNNDWRSRVNAMMTDQDYAAKAASVIGDTRSKNLKLMNKSAEDYPALSIGQQTKSPLDLARVPEMQQEQAARATMGSNDEDYSGVVDLATRLYAEERKASIDKANKQNNTSYSMAPHGMQFSSAASDIRADEQAKNIQKIYGKVLENKVLYDAIHSNANRILLKAMEKNQSMTDDEKKKVYEESVGNQLNAIGKSIDKYLYDVNAPKSELEWIAKNAVNSSIMGQMLTSAGDVEGGENVYRQQAMADYGKDASWWAQGLSTVGSLVMDTLPMSGITTAIAQPVSRATMWGVSRIGGRALQNSILGKVAVGMTGGSATLGGYNAVSTLATQFNNGYFNADELLSSTGHGLLLGGLTGAMSPWLRGVSAGMGKVGKVATMTGGLATEAGIFTASELSEIDNPYDLETIGQVFGKNVAVIGGLKISNLPKTIKEYKQWYTEGKQSNFTDADYKTMADFAKANGYAADDAFTMSADGAYSRSVADRVTGNRTLLTMTKLQGGKEQNLAIEMYNDPNVPLSLKTKIAAKMNLPAPPPVLPNGVRVEGNKAITYYTMSNGQQQVIEVKEFDRPRKARAYANEFSRTTARRNDLLQSEASVNVMMSQPMVIARLNEQAKRNGTTLADEKARMDAILQRAADGTITQEDIAYYRSIVEDDVTTTESLKKDIKAKFGVEIDEVLNKEGNFSAAEDEALTAYGNALRGIIERGNPTTERTATAAMAGIEDYVALNNLGIEQTSAILSNPEQRAAIEQQTRSHYAAWLKYFDGRMSEDALAQKLGLDLNNTSDLQTFISEQTYFKAKAADRIAYNTAEAAKQLLERGDGGVRFLDDGRVKLKGVPFAVEVSEDIAARYEAAKQGSGEPMQRIVNDALKDIIKQSETPAEPKEPIAEEMPDVEQPMTEAEAVTQQMVDARLAEIDTDLQGIDADGVQRMTINGKPVAIIKGRIVADENGQVDKTKSSAEVAYMLLDENGRPMLNEQGRPIIEVGVKPSNVRVENIEQWRSVDDYKTSEEQRIRDNNRITDEAMRQVDEQTEVENQVLTEPKTADDLLAMCDGDKALALDVATDELAKAMQAKGKGATPAETIEINKRIRMYQQMVDRLSATEQPESAALPEVEQTEVKVEPQVTEDMEFVYQQGLDENHEGMEPMKMADGRYKWVGLQRGELTANMGERDVELLDNLAKKLGVAVIPINVKDKAVNGYYRDGNIYVNTNRGAEWTMRWVAGHEMLHDVAKKSPDAYDAYKQAVLDMWGSDYIESQVKQIIEDYAKSGKTIDREQALTELVNDFGGELFNSRDGLKILDGILKDQSSKGNVGFIDTIKKWWDNIKEFFGVSPYANEVEKKLADAYKSAMKVMADRMGERKVVEQQELVTIGGLKGEAVVDDAIDNEGAEMSIVRDRNKIDELEGEELVPMLRTFQIFDGRLYPPMAAVQDGKKVHSVMVGDWWQSEENPGEAKVKVSGTKDEVYDKEDDRISKKDGRWVISIDGVDKPLSMEGDRLAYYFKLQKGEKGDLASDSLYARYNPYVHASKSALNDQFKGAYLRPNLVLVEILVPKSEIDGTNRYKADYAKDGIGFVPWNSGDVIKQAVAAGHPGREVALSRYAKIGRVFSNAEWADHIDAELAPYKDKIVLPFVMFPPEVLRGLANKGYKIEPPTSKKAQPYYEKWLNGEQPTDSNGGGKPTEDAEFSVKRRFGGNSGYVGYSKSVRAVDAEERGLRSVSKMDADFKDRVNTILADNGVDNPLSLAEIKRIAKGMKGDEWHHTSMYGNRTEYYSAESIAEKVMGKQSETAIDPRISAGLERMSYRESLADKMKTDRDIKIEVDLGNGKMHTYTVDAFRSSDGLLFDIGKALREEPIEKQSQINILNTGQVGNRELYLPEWYINDHSKEITKAVAEYNSALAKAKQELDAEFSIKADKQKQLDIINRTNPAHDDYHTWIRTTDDIKTLQEAVDEVKAEDADYNLSTYPDVTDDMINEALQSGKITIYSSKPIKEGVFVSPSQMQAKDYAGGGRIYSKQVSISDVAWINTDEGMFAPTEYSVKGKRADESVLDYAKRMSEETGKKNLLNGGSYFSGGGLLEEGLKGIVNPTIAVEFNQKVAGVYRNNFGEHIVTADVRNVDPASLVKNIDGPVAYFHASPVCKNFSRAKQSAEELPLDKATAQSTAEFISKVRPKIVTIENVKGYRDSESMKIILDELKKQGYNYDVDVYNAADYGAYTSRERLIVRAVRDWSLPAKPMVMLADDRPSGWLEAVADIIDTLPEKKGGVAKWMDERLMAMGIDYRNIDKPLYVFGSGYSKDRIGYAFADELVPTLRTKGGDVIVMPDGRVLKATPRVLARISGMSDEYQMPKTDDLAHTIVGNGIPVQLTKAVMGSLIENVKSDLDAGNTEYSIIGKRGAANLDKRDETSIRVDNMVTAEEMEKVGKDAKTIRMATGWERGADGKWRYEVKDLYMLPFREWIGMRGKKLKDIVENAEELFAAYPELANVKIKEGNGKTYGGSYSDGTITLDTHLAKLWMKHDAYDMVEKAEIEVSKTLIHEIQHYIQEKEGFAEGGNKSMILNKDAASEIDALISNSNKLAVQYNDMIAKGVYEGREAIKEKIISLRAEANAIKKKNVIGAEGYRSLAGEVEARNASKRMAMSEEERANTMLADTEDVGRDEQIVYGNNDDVQFSIKGGRSGLKGVHSDAYKRIIELADAYTKEVAEHENDYEWKDSYNDYSKRVEPLAKTLTDEALKELYNELEGRQDGLDMWIIDILKGREAMSMRKRADEQAESNKRALSKVKVELDALKEAVKSGNKSTIKRTKEALTEAVIKHGLGHKYMREQIALLKQTKQTDANYARNRAAAGAMENAVVSIEAELNNAIEKAGFEGVSLSFSNDYAFWLSAKQGSKFRETVEGLDNNERWFAEVDGRTGGLSSDLPQLTMNNIDEYVARVKDALAPGVTIENRKDSLERVDKTSKKEKAEYYKHGQIEQGRAEYEAKEQWRKENAGAIASSFFADRRADKAAEVERLKKKISELKADNTKAASEDKAKVREIADEMHAYIKKNIPTENQGDMTRQQFESVLKQLETAVTKQELEKPMQMVEYIGANVARRALTRQMRDFVKNGFKALTPKGLAKPKTVDGVTSRVLGLVKTLYQSMNKNAFGSDLYKLQKQVREEKAKLEQFNADNGGKYQDVVDKVNEILAKTGVDRYEELYKYFDEKQAAGDVDGEVLGYIGRMLPLLDSIELTKDQQKQAKADSAITTKEDLDQLRTSLEEKRDKGILSEEDKAVLDNMPLYEAMLSLHQQQLNIDGPGASSLAMQMKAKVGEIKEYGKKLDELDNKNSKTAIIYKTRIKEANNELQELFAARIVDQKAVNANVSELLDNLKEIRDTGKSKLQEWSKAKQERATRLVKMANESFGKDAKGYWSEVDKRGKLKKDFINWANNLRLSVLMSPAMSFEYMLGVMDPRYYTNNSPIYKQFIKSSEGLIKANDNFFEGTESYNMAVNEAVERFINRNAMTNLKEYFRRGDRFATAIIPFEVKVNRNGVDEYIPKEEMMTRGQAAKIYAWSRMADGMAKLKAHGVTDSTLTKVKEFIGEDYMNFIDWVEDEFFPRLRRERYNPVYKQMYGISMAENDHYFPFLIYQKDVRTEQELEVSNNDTLGGGVVGNLVERKRNNARLDFTAESPDIFDMITDYGRKMEEWAAYAQVREDLKKVVNDKQFKQHCDELGTHYYKYFLEAAQVASRLSRDMAMTQHTQSGWAKAQKTIASAAISLRVSTALKQLLSAPAFMVYSLDPAFHHELIKTMQPIDVESAIKGLWKLAEGDMSEAKKLLLSENWVGHYNWCVENLPSFRERVTLKGAGNPILEERGFFKFADDIQSVGMLPNRLVDAFTCSVGAKAIYEYAYKKYKKNYSEKTAHNMAVTDAEIAFNSSQQSSNPVFLAPMQVSKQFLLRGMMNYKNSPIGYYRNAMKASIDMYRATKAIFGQPKFTINGEVYGFENDGKNPFAMAAESGARASMFWLFLNLIWNFGTVGVAGLSYTMLNGSKNDDGNMLYTDEEIKKALGNDMGWALFNASNQGIPWVSGFSSAAQTGQDYTPSILFSEMNNYVEQINKDGFMSMATAQIFTDLLLKNAAGVDPEVWGQIYRGAQGIMEDRPMRIEDFMNLIASPRSAISGVTKQRVGEYDRLRDYVNDRIESNRQLGVDERMTFDKKLTGMRELSKKSLGMYVDEYLADKIPGYREFANKPTEMEKEEEVANSNTLNAASSLYETIVRKEEEKDEKKNKIKDPEIKSTVRLLTAAANVIHRLCEVNDFETAERIANEMERIIKRDYNPNGKTIEERLKNVDVWDSTGTTEQPSADGYNTAFERAIDGGFASYLRRGKD